MRSWVVECPSDDYYAHSTWPAQRQRWRDCGLTNRSVDGSTNGRAAAGWRWSISSAGYVISSRPLMPGIWVLSSNLWLSVYSILPLINSAFSTAEYPILHLPFNWHSRSGCILAVYGRAVTFGTAMRGLGGAAARPVHQRAAEQSPYFIQHRIEYKVAVLTFKSRSSATAPTYLSRRIKARVSERTLRSSAVPLTHCLRQ